MLVLGGMVWYGMVWYGMVWYGMVWYGMVWYGMVVENLPFARTHACRIVHEYKHCTAQHSCAFIADQLSSRHNHHRRHHHHQHRNPRQKTSEINNATCTFLALSNSFLVYHTHTRTTPCKKSYKIKGNNHQRVHESTRLSQGWSLILHDRTACASGIGIKQEPGQSTPRSKRADPFEISMFFLFFSPALFRLLVLVGS
jgi:hypothetical protein